MHKVAQSLKHITLMWKEQTLKDMCSADLYREGDGCLESAARVVEEADMKVAFEMIFFCSCMDMQGVIWITYSQMQLVQRDRVWHG